MASFNNMMYHLVLKRTSTFTLAVLASAFMFERGFDILADKMFDNINRGKLWKDIKHKYEQ